MVTPWLWAIFTVIAAFAQTLRNAMQRELTGNLGTAGELVTAAIYIAVAASTVAIPVLAYVAAGHRMDDPMARLKEWMERNNAAMLAVVLVLIGLMVVYNGAHALF